MPSTIQLSRTIGLAQNFVRNAPLTIGTANDPALSNADWVLQFMLAAPFAWPWNRNSGTFTCIVSPATQDYAVSVPDFGWLERATIQDLTESTNPTKEMTVRLSISQDQVIGQPAFIAPIYDDGAGNITFRLFPTPDKPYVVTFDYQAAAPLFTGTTSKWAPVPDRLSYLYNQGFLAKTYEYLGDDRFPIAMQLFLRQVIAANQGLDETQTNLFLADRMNSARETQETLGNAVSGRQGRGMF
jgi:hypothetical protein